MLHKFSAEILPSNESARELEFFPKTTNFLYKRHTTEAMMRLVLTKHLHFWGFSLFFSAPFFRLFEMLLHCSSKHHRSSTHKAHPNRMKRSLAVYPYFVMISWLEGSTAEPNVSWASWMRQHRQKKNVNNNSRGFAKKKAQEATPKFIHEKNLSLFCLM